MPHCREKLRGSLSGVNKQQNFVVAIDGPSGAGKGTLARSLAARYFLPYLDTGLIYRWVAVTARGADECAFAASALQIAQEMEVNQLVWHPPQGEWAEHEARHAGLRSEAVAERASIIAAIAEVRAALLGKQRAIAAAAGGCVLDGRDVTTVVCPLADFRFFVTATPQERARRRAAQLSTAPTSESAATPEGYSAVDHIAQQVVKRDTLDTQRVTAPLRRGEGVHFLDTTDLSPEEVLAAAVRLIEAGCQRAPAPSTD